eukprot:6731216-Pyramimonas_sp.AAC.1
MGMRGLSNRCWSRSERVESCGGCVTERSTSDGRVLTGLSRFVRCILRVCTAGCTLATTVLRGVSSVA